MATNLLAGSKIYLCGPIENATSPATWRHTLSQQLASLIPDAKIWDPMRKPPWVEQDIQSDQVAFGWKAEIFGGDAHKGQRCWAANQSVRRLCKQLANKCDFMIARLPKEFTWGSIDELEIAANRRIPVFLLLPNGPISIYGLAGVVYTYSTIPHMVHYTVDGLLDTLSQINKRQIPIGELDPETWMYLTWRNTAAEEDSHGHE